MSHTGFLKRSIKTILGIIFTDNSIYCLLYYTKSHVIRNIIAEKNVMQLTLMSPPAFQTAAC